MNICSSPTGSSITTPASIPGFSPVRSWSSVYRHLAIIAAAFFHRYPFCNIKSEYEFLAGSIRNFNPVPITRSGQVGRIKACIEHVVFLYKWADNLTQTRSSLSNDNSSILSFIRHLHLLAWSGTMSMKLYCASEEIEKPIAVKQDLVFRRICNRYL